MRFCAVLNVNYTILRLGDLDFFLQQIYLLFLDSNLTILSYIFLMSFLLLLLKLVKNVVFLNDPIYSLLSLVCLITVLCCYWIYLGLDFLGLIFLMVYVGAIAILFLFAIMMLNLHSYSLKMNSSQDSLGFLSYFVFFLIGFLFFLLLSFFIGQFEVLNAYPEVTFFVNQFSKLHLYLLEWNHFRALGLAFYSKYSIYLILSGFILFLGMVGPIILTFESLSSSYFISYKHLNSQTYRSWLLNIRKKLRK